ncbi:hypothetical protein T484DRAFT_1969078, partial [Baffinella frigidus]
SGGSARVCGLGCERGSAAGCFSSSSRGCYGRCATCLQSRGAIECPSGPSPCANGCLTH